MYWIVLIVLSLIIAWLLKVSFKNREIPGGYLNTLVGVLVGAWLGDYFLEIGLGCWQVII